MWESPCSFSFFICPMTDAWELDSPVLGRDTQRGPILPPMEDKECAKSDAGEADAVIPPERVAKISDRENREHRESDDFLDGLELRAAEFVRADAIGGYLKTIFEKSDAPTGNDDFPERGITVFQVAIPSKGHKDIRDREKNDGAQGSLLGGIANSVMRRNSRTFRFNFSE
jgi:hypothetical protein